MKIVKITFLLLLTVLGSVSAWAEESAATPLPHKIEKDECKTNAGVCTKREEMRKRCQEDPTWCEQRRQKVQEKMVERKKWCQANPEECQKIKSERQALKAQCQTNPDKCQELRKQFRQKQQQQRKAAHAKWCQANPKDCEQWKADMQKVKEQCQALYRQLQEKYPNKP